MKYTVIIFFLDLCGCASTGLFSKTGSAFVSVQTESGGVAYNKGDIKATGEACSYNVLGIVAIGDSSIHTARKYGGLSRVFYFDTEIVNAIDLFGMICTKVYRLPRLKPWCSAWRPHGE